MCETKYGFKKGQNNKHEKYNKKYIRVKETLKTVVHTNFVATFFRNICKTQKNRSFAPIQT